MSRIEDAIKESMSRIDDAIKEIRELREHDEMIERQKLIISEAEDAGYAYVESVRHTADDRENIM